MIKFRNNKGITLVALIITIIVLLILAMVSIRLVMNGGIISKAETSTKAYSDEEIGEQIKLAYSEYQIAAYSDGVSNATEYIKSRLKTVFGNKLDEDSVKLGNGKLKATIDGRTYKYDIGTGKAEEYIDPFNYGTKTKETIDIGDDITLGTEKFKVFSKTDTEIKVMPYYNLKLDSNPMRQATKEEADNQQEGKRSFGNPPFNDYEDAINMDHEFCNIQTYILDYKKTLNNMGAVDIEVRAGRKNEDDFISKQGSENINPSGKGTFWLGSGKQYQDRYDEILVIRDTRSVGSETWWGTNGVRPIIIIPI